ncbi:hypothetical protein ATK36_0876 [Amycolatopsis sulphurea]|uniref:Uncharacterized protein n=1 Tax=Amycolatopsis sulphurea TaxID=76022 RepID=A0A2A9G370_9PSEU|nr:hypothetical protein [Amycolatopsis sulphurea]PFG57302.1 hypothetical protein ATK36_0876 [Amycolatopsis sulphurea]
MHTRIQLDPGSTAVPCEQCGRPTLHVARLVREDGTPVSHTMVCTTCHPRRHRMPPRVP